MNKDSLVRTAAIVLLLLIVFSIIGICYGIFAVWRASNSITLKYYYDPSCSTCTNQTTYVQSLENIVNYHLNVRVPSISVQYIDATTTTPPSQVKSLPALTLTNASYTDIVLPMSSMDYWTLLSAKILQK